MSRVRSLVLYMKSEICWLFEVLLNCESNSIRGSMATKEVKKTDQSQNVGYE